MEPNRLPGAFAKPSRLRTPHLNKQTCDVLAGTKFTSGVPVERDGENGAPWEEGKEIYDQVKMPLSAQRLLPKKNVTGQSFLGM